MYPLLLKPIMKDRLWGGTRLIEEFGISTDIEHPAEAWVFCCENTIKNGDFAGLTLSQAAELSRIDLFGQKASFNGSFPLLVKLLDARESLSLHVHPWDSYSLQNEGHPGKYEFIYIIDCPENAKIILGLTRGINKEEFRHRATCGTLTEICNFVPVKKGDFFQIPAGTLHSIGKGILAAEIRYGSDITYRITDYGRTDSEGFTRPIHIEKAALVTNLAPHKTIEMQRDMTLFPFGTVSELNAKGGFICELLGLNGTAGLYEKESFISLLCINGEAVISYPSGNMRIKKGSSVLLPAGLRISITGKAEVLCTKL